MRLDKEIDQLDGIAWCIPLKHFVSVGISTEIYSHHLSDSTVMRLTDETFARRGIDYQDYDNRQAKLVSLRNQYFIHERAYGANWVLAGGTYLQVWFMSSSGVATGLYVAQLADQFLRSPLKMGQNYTDYAQVTLINHNNLDELISNQIRSTPIKQLREAMGLILLTNLIRLTMYAQLRNSRWNALFAKISNYQLTKKPELTKRLIENFCHVVEADLPQQTESIYAFVDAELAR